MTDHAQVLGQELDWLDRVIDTSIRLYFGQPSEYQDVRAIAPPKLQNDGPYHRFIDGFSFDARLILILALAPVLKPQILDPFLMKNDNFGRGFTEFGGITSGTSFLPTLETAAFILTATNLQRRLALQSDFGQAAFFCGKRILDDHPGQTRFSLPLNICKEQLPSLTTGERYQPGFDANFPAQRLNTNLEWDDLVVDDSVMDELENIRTWITHSSTLLSEWRLQRNIKPGYRSLFFGPPGTGKTLSAALLGKSCQRDVYRIDLSLVVSKYIGETEKNLSGVFDQAEQQDWILFFDEADALFGKRTQTSSSHDRYANQEVAFLLQKFEEYPGVVLLASNLKSNIDEAFSRRFQSMIYFSLPAYEERLRLWQNTFQASNRLEENVCMQTLAQEHSLSGGSITNILRYSALSALRRQSEKISLIDIQQGIRKELRKEGKLV